MSAPPTAIAYLRARAAHRDAIALLRAGLLTVTEPFEATLERTLDSSDLDVVIQMVVVKEAADLLDLFGSEDISADQAAAISMKTVKRRYRGGVCALCKGPALPCARRHARGRSCE